jgi:hypothetical protein
MHAELAAEMIGPDFIQKLSDVQLGNGLETDATALRANADAWRKDIERGTALSAANDDLREKLDAASERLAEIARTATVRA